MLIFVWLRYPAYAKAKVSPAIDGTRVLLSVTGVAKRPSLFSHVRRQVHTSFVFSLNNVFYPLHPPVAIFRASDERNFLNLRGSLQ
jgi:hypothetical protein